MSDPCKIVTLTPEERDEFRKLRDAEAQAIKAFADFKNRFQTKHSPETRRYAPFEKVEMTILDQPGRGAIDVGTAHAYFVKGLA